MSAIRSLTGVDRTWRGQPNSVEIDPTATFSEHDCRCYPMPAPALRSLSARSMLLPYAAHGGCRNLRRVLVHDFNNMLASMNLLRARLNRGDNHAGNRIGLP
jgi:hypothetical protein